MTDRWLADDTPLQLGVSACLLGREVRHDGGHKRDRFLTDVLGSYVEWVPICPEVEVGMSIPRPSIRLVQSGDELRLVEPRTGADHTRSMATHSARRVHALDAFELCGYVLKKDSPSCGMDRVKVWHESGQATRNGRGLFASALIARFGTLPVEEEGRLADAGLRENFIERIFAYRRLRALFRARWTVGELVAFHTAHKLLLLAHSEVEYRRLGRLVAEAKRLERAELRERYEQGFMGALARIATSRRHTNVLQHMVGYLREGLDAADRAELAALVEDYRRELVPLVVPLALLRHHVRRLDVAYLRDQIYLDPHPKELMLRNHV
ncbi:MAG: DUF523 and DUF1722 domain-containing protein [Deltaproteobacteria bacterium]|nr:DUF523 and DUF1722 domain-containing protein [Deltaproteobacteria bacterium]